MKGFTGDKTFVRIFLSYVIVLVIPLIFGVFISRVIADTVYQELVELGTYSAHLTQSKIDTTFNSILSSASKLAADDTLRKTVTISDGNINDPVSRILINSMSVKLFSISNDLIDNVYLYYNVNNSVISYDGRINSSSTSWYLNKELELTGADLMNIARKYPVGEILMTKRQDNPCLIAVVPVYERNSYKLGGVLCLKIDKYLLSKSLKEYKFGNGAVFITDGDSYISSSGETGYDFSSLKANTSDTLYTISRDSVYTGIKYRLTIPTKTYFSPFYKAIQITVIYAVFCVIGGILVVLYLSYSRYRLIKSFMSLTSTSTPKDAIQSIQRTLTQSTQYKLRFGNYQVKVNQLKREKQLEVLFTYMPDPDQILSSLEEYEIIFPHKFYTVVIIDMIMDYTNLFFGEEKSMNEDDLYMHATTILRAVYEELFSAYAAAYVTTTSDCRVCIVNFDSDNGEIDRTLHEAAEFCKTNFGIELLCCRGQTVSSIDRLKDSLRSAMSEAITKTNEDIPRNELTTIGEAIKNYIGEHYSNKSLDISLIADAIKLSHSYVSRIFKQTTGHTVLEYISLCRITEAKRLLRDTNINVRKISEMVGYSSVRTFTRTMQKLEEMSPSEYRYFSQNKK